MPPARAAQKWIGRRPTTKPRPKSSRANFLSRRSWRHGQMTSGLPGKRVEAKRAGMMPAIFIFPVFFVSNNPVAARRGQSPQSKNNPAIRGKKSSKEIVPIVACGNRCVCNAGKVRERGAILPRLFGIQQASRVPGLRTVRHTMPSLRPIRGARRNER